MKSMKDRVWETAKKVPGKDPDLYREDHHGNLIRKDLYGEDAEQGWEIDYLVPRSSGGTNNISNMQVLQSDLSRRKVEHLNRYFRGRR